MSATARRIEEHVKQRDHDYCAEYAMSTNIIKETESGITDSDTDNLVYGLV